MKRTLTLTEVARATGKSRSTVRRALDTGQFPNAVRDDDSHATWRVPVSDLKRLGWTVHDTDDDAGADSTATVRPQSALPGAGLVPWSEVLGLVDRNGALQSELADARVELARVQFRLEAAERELEAAKSRPRQVEPAPRVDPVTPRRRWGLRG